ncbi:MAG: DMT family transporter [Candidatus Puniceispirillales bacterium WSBS_2018_MAG_OTU23]
MFNLSLKDILLGVIVAFVWGMGLVFAKGAMIDFPPILLTAFRFLVTALMLVWFVPIPKGQWWLFIAISVVAATIQYSFTFTGLQGLHAGTAAFVVQTEVPFLVLLGAILLGERTPLRTWLGVGVAFGGVALIAGEIRLGNQMMSILLVIAGAFFWAVGQTMIRRLKDVDGLTVTAWVAVLSCPQLFLTSLLLEDGHIKAISTASVDVWLTIIYLGAIMTAFGYYIWNSLIIRNPVSQIAPVLLLLPMFSAIGGFLFLGERLSLFEVVGGGIVLVGVYIVITQKTKPA